MKCNVTKHSVLLKENVIKESLIEFESTKWTMAVL